MDIQSVSLHATPDSNVPNLIVTTPSFTPSNVVSNGTVVTVAETAYGVAPFYYQWQTDGGSGGTLTNIPSANASNLVVNTTGYPAGSAFGYDVIVTNASGSITSAVVTLAVPLVNSTGGILTDIGATAPTPGAYDIAQLTGAQAGSPAGLNYYDNNNPPAGQTFATGNNASGYVLNTVAIKLAGGSGGLSVNGQPYYLRIYSVSGSSAVLYATYESQTNFVLTAGANDADWVQWSGFAIPLKANTVYAYSFGDQPGGAGYVNLASNGANPYAGGRIGMVPINGGAIGFGSDNVHDGTFDLGLSLGTVTLGAKNIGGGQMQLSWPTGVLLQATNVFGPWTINTSATSPYTVTPAGSQMFYKIKVQ